MLMALAGCAPTDRDPPPGPEPAPQAPPAALPSAAPSLHVDGPPRPLVGLCEPSGAARQADGTVWLVDDDQRDALYAWTPGARPTRQPLDGRPFKDGEGLAIDGEGGLWLTGGLGRGGDDAKVGKRGVVLRLVGGPNWAVDLSTDALRPRTSPEALDPLRTAIAAACPACALPSDAAGTEEGHALDVEGLAWTPDGRLLFGLRAPLVADKAVVFSVDPAALREDAPMDRVVTAAWALDLGGRGIRDLGPSPGGDLLILAGGPTKQETPGGALYRWRPGGAPSPIGPLPALDAPAEAIVADGERAAWVFLDEGRRLSRGLRRGGAHAGVDDGETVFECGAGAPRDWAHAVRLSW